MRFSPSRAKRHLIKKLNKDSKVRGALVYAAIRQECKLTKELKQHGIDRL